MQQKHLSPAQHTPIYLLSHQLRRWQCNPHQRQGLASLCEVAVGTQLEANGHSFPLSHFTLQPLPSPPQREGQQMRMGLKSPGELGKYERVSRSVTSDSLGPHGL